MAVWLRSRRFDVGLQLGALAGIAPALFVWGAFAGSRAASILPLASLVAIPFVHVFGSFFVAFSTERNRSASPPRRLAVEWAIWAVAALVLLRVWPRGLATFALVYGGWHIFRQNFGFVRELAARAGLAGDKTLRRLDHLACAAPAVALWLLIASRGPWDFLGADVYHVAVPRWLVALAFAAIPGTIFLRERRSRSSAAGLLLLAGNALALVGPALVVDDLTVIYTLAASYHGLQYLFYVAERERERRPELPGQTALLPLASAVALSMLGWSVAIGAVASFASPAVANAVIVGIWYAVVPFHYFVDGKIWRRARVRSPRIQSGHETASPR
jgi:hypothetical protein